MQWERNLPHWRDAPFQWRGGEKGGFLPPPPTHLTSDAKHGFLAHDFQPPDIWQRTFQGETWRSHASPSFGTTKMAVGCVHPPTGNQRHNRPGGVQQPMDLHFKRKVGIIFTMLKAVHHLEKLFENTPPRFIHNLTRSLSRRINPFMASTITTQRIHNHAENWRTGLVFILQNHYHFIIEEQLKQLKNLPYNQWDLLFNTAAAWAKKSLSTHRLPLILFRTWNLIHSRFPGSTEQPLQTRDGTTPPGASTWNTPPWTISSPLSRGHQSPARDSTRRAAPIKAGKKIPPAPTRNLRTVFNSD